MELRPYRLFEALQVVVREDRLVLTRGPVNERIYGAYEIPSDQPHLKVIRL